jgi:uncharacterized protein
MCYNLFGELFMDEEYLNIVSDILNNDSFKKISDEVHHQGSRLTHCINVSYMTYKVCKRLNLDYISASRAALLHDYFFNNEFSSHSRLYRLINHYKRALINANNIVSLNDMERNIISSHMFPVGGKMPKYKESVLVDIIDDIYAIYEVLTCKFYIAKYSVLSLIIGFFFFK